MPPHSFKTRLIALRQKLVRTGLLETAVLLSLLLIGTSLWALGAVTATVLHGGRAGFDETLLLALRVPGHPDLPLGPAWLPSLVKDITALGGTAILTLLTIAIVTFLLLEKKARIAILIAGAVVGGLLLSTAMKHLIDRPRPSIVTHLTTENSMSFPSGHSMLAAVTYLTLGTLLARHYRDPWLKFFFLGAAILITLLVGLSRIYLGVHYPTDVLGGWCAGIAWALFCNLITRRLQARGQVEPEVTAAQ